MASSKNAAKRQKPWLRQESLNPPREDEAPPASEQTTLPPGVPYLLDRHQIVALTGLSYPTLWKKMCEGEFPRGRSTGGKTFWLSTEIAAWMANLPVRRLKGDERD